MNHVLSIAKKELRAYFTSPVALIFLGAFLLTSLFVFFWVETFFLRNIADVRPLFSWLPILLIFLVGALSMRLWSEEQKLGTLEILLTLPVETHKLVLGKFLGGLALVGIALLLTLGIPLTVSMMGNLDFGPVIGSYLGALLLAGAYLSIGLFVSSLTENQIVALIFTCVTCGAFYAIGTEPITNLAGTAGAEILRAFGTGARFESIARGVLDVRDLVYYGSLIFLFLVLNTYALEKKRFSEGPRTSALRMNWSLGTVLVALNLFLLTAWLAPIHSLRVDLTAKKEYSISKVTKDLVGSLDAPLKLRGYFSSKTHPLLAPLVPQIRDFLKEYEVLGDVKAEFVDPAEEPELEEEANQTFGIKAFPFRIASRHEDAVVNSYFSVLVQYGDQFEVLNFDDLIEVKATADSIDVRLRNLEYDLTRAIKKVAFSFQPLEALFADVKGDVEFTAFVTPKTLPDNFKDVGARLEKVLGELKGQSGGKLKYSIVDPDAGSGEFTREGLYQKYGFRPMATSLLSQESFYLHFLMKIGDRYERLMPPGDMSEADIKKEIVASLKRGATGFLKTIAYVKPKAATPPRPQFPGQPPPPDDSDVSRLLRQKLAENYTLREETLASGRVPGDVDAILLLGPKDLDEKQRFAIDQYLMLGGTVVVFAGKYELDPEASQQGVGVKKVSSGLDEVLASYGVTIEDRLVLDPQNEAFPIPVTRNLGGLRLREIQLMPYPFFVDVRSTGMDEANPVVAGLPSVTVHWASPVTVATPPAVDGKPLRTVTTLLRSSPESWVQSDSNVQPDFAAHPEGGFKVEGERAPKPLAVAIQGKFESAFKDKPSPVWEGQGDRTGRTIKESPDSARLVVVGSSSFFSDLVLGLARQTGGDKYLNNLQFVENLTDWAVADTDLLSIRSRGSYARTLMPMDAGERKVWEWVNYGLVLLGLFGVMGYGYGLRRRIQPLDLGRVKRPTPMSIEPASTEVRS